MGASGVVRTKPPDENNPLRVLDSKDPGLQKIIEQAPKLLDHLNDLSKIHYETVKKILIAQNISYIEDPTLVRGLDYYTHTVYEITSSGLGAQNALCGGGRYDKQCQHEYRQVKLHGFSGI